MPQQKTYWHLAPRKRMPTEYELVSSRLQYYKDSQFEVNVPLAQWYEQYQQKSPFACKDWEQFCDPRETTYASYVALQSAKEVYVNGLLESIEASGYDFELSDRWIGRLKRIVAPLRYPFHGFQMIASYVASMAPSGRITITAMFQAADEMRRIQHIAYRIAQLRLRHPEFGDDSKALWQSEALYQPLREAVEKMLVVYDWGESFTGFNLVLKPMIDELFMSHFGRLARQEGDYILQQILVSLSEDCRWQQEWSQALVQIAIADRLENRDVVLQWVNKWYGVARRAVCAFAPVFEEIQGPSGQFEDVTFQIEDFMKRFLGPIGWSLP